MVLSIARDSQGRATIIIDSGAAASAMPEAMLPNVPHCERAENEFCRVTNGTKMEDRGGKKITFKTRNEGTPSMNFRVADVATALASVTKICHKKNRDLSTKTAAALKSKR